MVRATAVFFSLFCFTCKHLHFYLCTGTSPALQPWTKYSLDTEVKVHSTVHFFPGNTQMCCKSGQTVLWGFSCLFRAAPGGVVVTQLVLLKQKQTPGGCWVGEWGVSLPVWLRICSCAQLLSLLSHISMPGCWGNSAFTYWNWSILVMQSLSLVTPAADYA